jgi:anti-sigma B factor antagonist
VKQQLIFDLGDFHVKFLSSFIQRFNYPVKHMALTLDCQVILFQPEGRIDSQGGIALSEKIAEVIPQPEQLWVIDLLKVDFMDSSGLVSLVKALKTARQSGCRLVLCNVQPPVRLVLELTQLDSVFEIFETYEKIFTETKDKNLVEVG